MRAQGDQLGEVGDRAGLAQLRDPDETVRVEVVAEEERRVAVGGREESRATVVKEIALVDRLDREGMRRVRQR